MFMKKNLLLVKPFHPSLMIWVSAPHFLSHLHFQEFSTIAEVFNTFFLREVNTKTYFITIAKIPK